MRNAGPLAVALAAAVIVLGLGELQGCAAVPPEVREIPVPVEVPAPPRIERPRLALGDIFPDSKPDDVVRAYRASVEALIHYARQLETALDAYRKKETP